MYIFLRRLSVCLSVFAVAFVLSTGVILAQDNPGRPIYENHSLMHLPRVADQLLPDFYRCYFDIVEKLPDGGVKIVATPKERDHLISKFGATVEIENLEEYYQQGLSPDKTMGGYHTNGEVEGELWFTAYLNPDIAHLDTIGYSLQGRPIYALKISDNPEIDEEDEPDILLNGMIHAREPIGMEIILHTMNYLIDNRTDPEVAELINTTEIWLVPVINPDGYVYNEEISINGGGMWRKNMRDNGDGTFGVDLNRNWDFIWGIDNISSSPDGGSQVYRGTAPFSEPETQVISNFINAHEFPVIVNYHAYGDYYVIPFSVPWVVGCPDNFIYAVMGDSLTRVTGLPVPFYVGSGLGGGANGWQYAEQIAKRKSLCILVEVGPGFWPPSEMIVPLCEQHHQANMFFIREAHRLRYRPTRSLATEFTHIDSVIDGCSADFIQTATFWNSNDTASFEVNVEYFDDSQTPGWCSVDQLSAIINPGDTFTTNINFFPSLTAGMQNEYRPVGYLLLILSSMADPPVIDTVYFHLSQTFMIDDADLDGYSDCYDNCPDTYNPDRVDVDADGWGDACDNCPEIYNADQADSDGDFVGDLCDICPGFDDLADYDQDGYPDSCDNCPVAANPGQEDTDQDGIGDHCDFLCGDANGDDEPNVGDAVYLINYVFKGGPAPDPVCAGDVNGDDEANVGDAVFLISYIFKGGPAPLEACCP